VTNKRLKMFARRFSLGVLTGLCENYRKVNSLVGFARIKFTLDGVIMEVKSATLAGYGVEKKFTLPLNGSLAYGRCTGEGSNLTSCNSVSLIKVAVCIPYRITITRQSTRR
jgi:hypothetical protein